ARPSPPARRTGEAHQVRDARAGRQVAGAAERQRAGRPGHPATASPASLRRQTAGRTGSRPSQGRRPAARSQARPAGRGARTSRQRPRQPRYWLRWLLVIVVTLALLAAVSYAVLAAATWARDTIREQDEQQAADAVVTVYPNPVACPTGQLEVAMSAPTAVATGAGLSVDVTLTNTGTEACLLDVGASSLGLVITSGGVGQWSSLTCPAEPAQRLLLVNAGESATTSLTWDGRLSTGQCPSSGTVPETTAPDGAAETAETTEGEAATEGEADGQAAPVAESPVATEGTYVLHLEMGGAVLTGDHVFVIG
ncbi:hypothetical protein, partial [Actinomyces sp. 186855]|uniref:hypothetical protein n=1 Tax=Actinomyces sp. 186855 TaxID=2761164 RepID=UPI00202E50F6